MRTARTPAYLQLRRDDQGRDLDEHSHDERADHGAPGRAEAAQDDRSEDQQQHPEAEQVVDLLDESEHHAGHRGQRGADDPHRGDHPVDVDAGRRRERRVVGDGPGRLADASPDQRQGDQREHDDADAHDPQVARGVGERPDVDGALDDVLVIGPPLAGEDVEVEVAQQQADADRDDHQRDQAGSALAQRPPEPDVLRPAEHPAQHDGQHARQR